MNFCSIAFKKVNIINIETRIHIHIRVYYTRTPKKTQTEQELILRNFENI